MKERKPSNVLQAEGRWISTCRAAHNEVPGQISGASSPRCVETRRPLRRPMPPRADRAAHCPPASWQ
eukprot:CAMPEP_0184395462 /NCGR_PEP_ID=MMETSP0007-20130409/44323_1 /TAXON_ID=97485 /ORGANISM="Prymnesium parvum, Strain Texoma1" /LENGTH=66 /DNA_ID=CAMNT_0026747631 /DNA_START=185 /DNA_END=385 /DNA_ORIENTATION=-